ncbi:dirigent protein 3-like [Setaria italica]|uniref:dirigent protein 3-like n=1 Tax=Setaria italica TaxID=4555 RepID=UPI0006480F28|nr:dirigent protein 3-like [Setaria italica]
MHDIIGGPEQTAIHLIRNAGPPHKSLKGAYFGDTMAIDDLVTDGPGIDSGSVGRAQGTYMLSSQHEEVLVAAVTVALTGGPYSGSTFSSPAASGSTISRSSRSSAGRANSGAPPATCCGGWPRWCPRCILWWS